MVEVYRYQVPRLWTATIDAHRRAVVDAILDATSRLVAQHGPAGVKMSQIAEDSGIGRATLYKYFPDVDSILVAWHERQVEAHLTRLAQVRDATSGPLEQLTAVLAAYAQLSRHDHSEIAASLHRGDHARRANEELQVFLTDLVTDCVDAGVVRDDVPAAELAAYCLHATGAARDLPSPAAVQRLVALVVSTLRVDPPAQPILEPTAPAVHHPAATGQHPRDHSPGPAVRPEEARTRP